MVACHAAGPGARKKAGTHAGRRVSGEPDRPIGTLGQADEASPDRQCRRLRAITGS